MSRIELRIDVTSAVPVEVSAGKTLDLAAWLFLPQEPRRLASEPNVIVCLVGGTYDRRYYDFEVPGGESYSVARQLADAGNIVLVPDHLGVGDSTRPAHPAGATREVVAGAMHAAVSQIFDRLRAGALTQALPPLRRFTSVGLGHSMGGMLLITQQAQSATFDRVVVLGYTASAVHLHLGDKFVAAEDMISMSTTQGEEPVLPDYVRNDRRSLRRTFHWEDVAESVLVVDDSLLVDVPRVISFQALTRGIVRMDAARITCPVFIGLGERDVSPALHQEPTFYHASRDVTLYILPRSGHCHNFASTRRLMFDRILHWMGVG